MRAGEPTHAGQGGDIMASAPSGVSHVTPDAAAVEDELRPSWIEDEQRRHEEFGKKGKGKREQRRRPTPEESAAAVAAMEADLLGDALRPAWVIEQERRQRARADELASEPQAPKQKAKTYAERIAEMAAKASAAAEEKIARGTREDIYGNVLVPEDAVHAPRKQYGRAKPAAEPVDPQSSDSAAEKPPTPEPTKERKKQDRAAWLRQRHGEGKRKQDVRDTARRERQTAKWHALGLTDDQLPPDIPGSLYRQLRYIIDDRDGKRIPHILQEEARRVTGYPFACLREALGDNPDWTIERNRVIAALAVFFLGMMRRTKRTKDQFQSIVRGIGIGTLMSLLHKTGKPHELIYEHRNGLANVGRKSAIAIAAAAAVRWRDYTRMRPARVTTWKTALQELRDCGFLYPQQLHHSLVKAWERDTRAGHEHHVRNRYWVATMPMPNKPKGTRLSKRSRMASPVSFGGLMASGAGEQWAIEVNARCNVGWDWIAGMIAGGGGSSTAPLTAAM